MARGATEWRDATQHATRRATQLSVSCVTAVTEATAAVRAAEEAEAISITGVETSAVAAQEGEDQSAVLDEDGGQGTTRPVQIRQSLVNGRTLFRGLLPIPIGRAAGDSQGLICKDIRSIRFLQKVLADSSLADHGF